MARSGPGEFPVNIPGMQAGSRMKASPIPVARTLRGLDHRVLTSMPAGKMCPIAAWPLLREDRLTMSRFRLNFEMMETAELLVNAVNVRVMAYLVPNLALPRFNGIDQLNRSYSKQPETDGGTVQPFFVTKAMEAVGANPIFKIMGKHARPGQMVNQAYIEAYNVIWNYRAKNRSPDLPQRLLTDTALARAFWVHQTFAHIVPDFDQALIDGEIPISAMNPNLPVTGLNVSGTLAPAAATGSWFNTKGAVAAGFPQHSVGESVGTANQRVLGVTTQNTSVLSATNLPQIFAELGAAGVTVTLSNIELARKTQAFAVLRKQYSGLSDDYIIDMLMNGLSVPEQAWRTPILLADKQTIFGMAKRYASDSLDLTASVANGATFVDLAITTPRVPTGGVVMIIAEIAPEQLWERQQDPYLFMSDTAALPEFLRDTLDPEKVEIVENQYVDVNHTTPTATFGYAPLNHKWNRIGPAIGGKFFRPATDAPTDEDRQRIWAVETANPTLASDFYLVTNMHTKPFVVTNQDPFEVVLRGSCRIEGNTVMGRMLVESTDDYAKIGAEAPIDRIDLPPATFEAEEAEQK